MGVHNSFESLLRFCLDLLQLGKLHLQIGNLINAETFCGFNDLFFIHINLKQKNPVLPKDSCQVIIDTVLEKLMVNAVNRIQLVPTDIPFKQNVWAGWYTLPCVDGGHCIIGELQAPFDVDFVIDWIVVLVRCAEYSNQLIVSA